MLEAESISAGLDYPGVGPEHAHLADIGRARYEPVTDAEVLDAFQLLARTEGIIPALESAHALAWVLRARDELAGQDGAAQPVRAGDKDVAQVADILGATAPVAELARARGPPAGAARRRPQAARPVRHRRAGAPGPTSCAPSRPPAPTPSRSASRSRDPVMDGPTIQEASEAALEQGATLGSILADLRDVDAGVPLVVMTYFNLVFQPGHAGSPPRPWPPGWRA